MDVRSQLCFQAASLLTFQPQFNLWLDMAVQLGDLHQVVFHICMKFSDLGYPAFMENLMVFCSFYL